MPVIKVKSEEVKIKIPATVLRIEPTTQAKTVEPSIEEQLITPDEGVFALSSVTVNPVTSEIDENIKAENIKEGISILGVEGGAKVATPDLVNINDYLETTITNENSSYFFVGKIFKNFPQFVVEATDGTNLFRGYTGAFVPYLDTSGFKSFDYMCYGCSNIKEIPQYDTSNGTVASNMFYNCSLLETIPKLDFSSVNSGLSGLIANCYNLMNLGGFENLGKAYDPVRPANYSPYTLTLSRSTKLTEQSLINVLNNLYDIASLGVKVQTCQLGTTNLEKLTSAEGQQALATAQQKGWTIS